MRADRFGRRMIGSRSLMMLATIALLAGCIQAQPTQTTTPATAAPAPTAAPDCKPPTIEPGSSSGSVANSPGSFSYSEQPTAKTAKEAYAWQNPSTAAGIQWTVQGAAGSLTLTVLDACGKTMYQNSRSSPSSQSGSSSEMTPRGRAGTWTVELDHQLFTGQMSLQISSS